MRRLTLGYFMSVGSVSTVASMFKAAGAIAVKSAPVDISVTELKKSVSSLETFNNGKWFAVVDTIAAGTYTVSLLQVQDEALSGLEMRLKALSTYTTELATLDQNDARYAELESLVSDIERETSWFVGFNAVTKTGEISIDTRSVDGSPIPVTELNYLQLGSLSTILGDGSSDIGILEVNASDVLNAYHSPKTCPICQAAAEQSGSIEQSVAAATDSATNSVGYQSVTSSGTSYIDALNSMRKWDLAEGEALSYSYYDGTVPYDSTVYTGRADLIANATDITSQATNLDLAFAQWSDASGISFEKVTETSASNVGEIRVAYSTEMGTTTFGGQAAAFAFYPSTTALAGDSWFGDPSIIANNASFAPGGYGFVTAVHEFGHAIGVSHPFTEGDGSASSPTGTTLPSSTDNRRHTVMSYNQLKAYDRDLYVSSVSVSEVDGSYSASRSYGQVQPTTLGVYDVAIAEFLYGAGSGTRTGDNTYSFTDGQKFMETIVDHGGTDTIDASAQSTSSIIDLTPGAYSSIGLKTVGEYAAEVATMVVDAAISAGYATESGRAADEAFWSSYYTTSFNSQDDGNNTIYNTSNNDLYYLGQENLGIAYSATIENAIGGAGDDTITGNTAANILKGGVGDDSIDGGTGIDTAIFSGAYADYTITNSGGRYTVTDNSGTDGTDTLSNIEAFEFSDLTYRVAEEDTVTTTTSALVSGTQVDGLTEVSPPHLLAFLFDLNIDADSTVAVIDEAINTVASQRGHIGSLMSRLDHRINRLSSEAVANSSALSKILDADMALEMSTVVAGQLASQAGAQVMGQASKIHTALVTALLGSLRA